MLFIIFSLVLFSLVSCEPDTVYSRYCHIDSGGWNRADTLDFNTDTLRHDGVYSFHLALRTTRRFPYQKIAVTVERKVYRQKEEIFQKRERAVCTIATQKGEYLGTGLGLLQYDCSLRALQLQTGDSISLRVSHFMADELLPDVRDVGILVERN